MAKQKVAMLTAGGLAPCLSSAVGGLIERYTDIAPEAELIAYKSGFRGLLMDYKIEITREMREKAYLLHRYGGSPIGNSRVKLTNVADCVKRGLVKEGENPLRVAIKLRKGIMWPEKPGVMKSREFVADDVLFSFARAAGDGSDMRSYTNDVKEVRKVGDHVVEIETKAPFPILPDVISLLYIMSKKWSACRRRSTTTSTPSSRRWAPGLQQKSARASSTMSRTNRAPRHARSSSTKSWAATAAG